MTYYIADQNGYVGDVASIHGLNVMFEELNKHGEVFRELDEKGVTEDLDGLKEALKGVPKGDPTIDNFRRLVYKCAGVLIISDGVE